MQHLDVEWIGLVHRERLLDPREHARSGQERLGTAIDLDLRPSPAPVSAWRSSSMSVSRACQRGLPG
jgi:hypothetical protein